LKEIIRFIEDLGYEIKSEVSGKSVVDELLGAFKGVVPKGMTSKSQRDGIWKILAYFLTQTF